MALAKDIQEMISVLTTAVAIHEREEQFFRRSAAASTSQVAKDLFSEIADELKSHVIMLESRKQKLLASQPLSARAKKRASGQDRATDE